MDSGAFNAQLSRSVFLTPKCDQPLQLHWMSMDVKLEPLLYFHIYTFAANGTTIEAMGRFGPWVAKMWN